MNVAFVCLGNICRSPMAELIFRDMVRERGLEGSFNISSFGTSSCEEGSPIYSPAKRTLIMHGIAGEHTARQLTKRDVINSDYVLVMDSGNLCDVLRLTGGNFGEKIFKLLSFSNSPRDIADPWYTLDFERAFSDIREGCECFLEYVLKERAELISYNGRH